MIKKNPGEKLQWLYKLILFQFLSFISITICSAQHYDLANWQIVNVKYNLNSKWSLFGEGQLRAVRFLKDYNYYEYKGGFNYLIAPNFRFTFGLGKYATYSEEGDFQLPKISNEFRLWPQLLMQQSLWNLKIEHRYRYDMRFTNTGYHNRYRYRLAVACPFGKTEHGYKPFVLGVSDELLFIDKRPFLDRNRLMFSLGYQISKATSFQLGYLYQYDNKVTDEITREYLQICLYIELFRDPEKHTHIEHSQKGD